MQHRCLCVRAVAAQMLSVQHKCLCVRAAQVLSVAAQVAAPVLSVQHRCLCVRAVPTFLGLARTVYLHLI